MSFDFAGIDRAALDAWILSMVEVAQAEAGPDGEVPVEVACAIMTTSWQMMGVSPAECQALLRLLPTIAEAVAGEDRGPEMAALAEALAELVLRQGFSRAELAAFAACAAAELRVHLASRPFIADPARWSSLPQGEQ